MESAALWLKLSFYQLYSPAISRMGPPSSARETACWLLPPRRSQYKFKAHVSRALKKPVQLYLSIFQIYLTAEPFSTLTLYNSARSFVR